MHREQKIQQYATQYPDREQTQNTPDTERTENSTYDLHKYSFDLYHEYAYIKNSNTIELYTISK